ncbi:hypothetical protein NQZ68_038745 [Dissostichus eleginoides]|nr:hypothetical protein NQZ68_038745 [Dissostichus eleginoides]
MECPGGGGAVLGPANVPAFLTKLWTLVEDPDTDPLICWSPSGTSFHVFDQGRFSKEVLPKFFKHNNMASFIRQLNMYGFRKVVHIEQGGLVKPERDDTEFQHPFFIRGQEHLLENIKRKVTTVSSVRPEEVKVSSDDVNKILSDVQLMKGKQETIDSRIIAMRQENEALWREVASLRQKHVQQQKVVNKLIHFLVSLVQSNRVLGVKRKIPLMLNDSSSAHSLPKYSRPFSLEQAAASLFPADPPLTSGPIISDLTDVATPPADSVLSDWSDSGESQSVEVKEEPSNPVDSPVDTPLSPTTFINSILLDHEQPPLNPPNTASQSPTSSAPPPRCQTVACIDRSPRPPPSAGGLSPEVWRLVSTRPDKSELSHHVDSIDSLDVSLCFRSELSHHVDSIDSLDVCELSHHVDSIDSLDVSLCFRSELSHHVDSIDSLDVSLCFRSELSHHVDSIDSLDVSLCFRSELSHHVDSIDSLDVSLCEMSHHVDSIDSLDVSLCFRSELSHHVDSIDSLDVSLCELSHHVDSIDSLDVSLCFRCELSHHVDSIDSLDVSLCFRSELSHHVDSIDSLDVSLCELSHHVDSIDSGLQSLLNSQALNFDPSPLMEFFSSPCPSGDFDLDSLDTLLSDDAPNGGEESIYTGRQLVQYTGEGGGAYLPSLLELEAEPFFISDPPTDDPASTLLSPAHLDSDL